MPTCSMALYCVQTSKYCKGRMKEKMQPRVNWLDEEIQATGDYRSLEEHQTFNMS